MFGILAIFVDEKREVVALDVRKSTLLVHNVAAMVERRLFFSE